MPLFLENIEHILVINLKYLGDSIWMLPFVENLKANMPDVKLSVLVNKGTEAFFYNCPAVDNVIPFPRNDIKNHWLGGMKFISFIRNLRKLKPDMVIDLTESDRAIILSYCSGAKIRISYKNEKSWRQWLLTHNVHSKIYSKHMVDYYLDVLRESGLKIYDDKIKINLPEDAFYSLKNKFPTVFGYDMTKKKVIVHPGSRNALRQWGTEKFAYLCDALSEKCRIFLVSGPAEDAILNEVRKYMKTEPEICSSELNLYEFAALCELSDMFIGNDSGPIHIASAKTFTVGIYGPTLPEFVSPWTDRKLIFDCGSLPCRPCRQDKCLNAEFKACLKMIRPE
ncbi:MAG: glycosyltransferase family 9 protein, partial [Nitrospirota bacterium]|nr:glycosyltransferase family 9 protein [Nitrospirota bacterium]